MTGSITTDAYTNAAKTIDIDSLYTVVADFCEDTITYACTSVTRTDSLGAVTNFNVGDFPETLCTLSSANVLTV